MKVLGPVGYPATFRNTAVSFAGRQDAASVARKPSVEDSYGLSSRLGKFRPAVAAIGIAGLFLPAAARPVAAAITPESASLLQTLDSKDEDLVEAALHNLATVNEADLVHRLKGFLTDGHASESILKAAIKASGRMNHTPGERAAFSKLLIPYLQNVVLVEKDNHVALHPVSEAEARVKKDATRKLYDLRREAAIALGKVADAETLKTLADAVQDPSGDKAMRMLCLEALKHAPADPKLDQEMLDFYKDLKLKDNENLAAAVLTLLIRHDVKEALPKLQEIFGATSTPSVTDSCPVEPLPAPIPIAGPFPGAPTPAAAPRSVVATPKDSTLSITPEDDDDFYPPTFHQSVLTELLARKNPDHAQIILRQMGAFPSFFTDFEPTRTDDFFRAMPADVQKEVVGLIQSKAAVKHVRQTNGRTNQNGKALSDAEYDTKVQERTTVLRELAVSIAISARLPETADTLRKIYSNGFEAMSLRHLAVSGSGILKDEAALADLMALSTKDSEDAELRFDALSAAMDVTTPPLAENLKSDSRKEQFLSRYARTFMKSDKFTHSFYKAELFTRIRDARKALIKANAPAAEIDEATRRIVDKHLQQMDRGTLLRQKFLASDTFKPHERKMLDYLGKNPNADGFLRILMIKTLGESKNKDLKPLLQELVEKPLTRTDIPDFVSSNDSFMFPGHTKQTIANSTRLAAIQALARVGDMKDAPLMEKGLWSDDRRLHMACINALGELGKNTAGTTDADQIAQRKALVEKLTGMMQQVDLQASVRMDNLVKNMYARAIDRLGGGDTLLALMDKLDPTKTQDTVLRRAIANGLIHNDKYLDNPKIAPFLLSTSLGIDKLQARGIDGRGTEMAIIDGDYINAEDISAKVEYPSWGRTQDAELRKSYHDETVASVLVGKRANITYGLAPGVDKIYSYSAWDDKVNPDSEDGLEARDGLIRSIDDIIAKKIAGKSKVSVVNMSLGTSSAVLYGDESTVKNMLNKLAARFELGSKAGITFVVSAGNEGGDTLRHYLVGTLNGLGFNKENGSLIQNKGVILVGATDTQGTPDRTKHRITGFSSVGDVYSQTRPDIVAPGSYLPLQEREANGDIVLDEADGTSFSAPITAAVILLMNQVHGKSMETEAVRKILGESAYPLTGTPSFKQGAGALDPVRAIEASQHGKVNKDFNEFLNSLKTYLQLKEVTPAK